MRFEATTDAPAETAADTVAIGLFAGERVPHDVDGGALQALVEAGEARSAPRAVAQLHAAGKRWLLVGLGERQGFDAERARAAAAVAHARARELGSETLCWEVPHDVGEDVVAGLVEGTALHAYRFDRFRRPPEDAPAQVETVLLSAHHELGRAVREAAVVAAAQNRARDLQNSPANHLTPEVLADRARQIAAAHDEVAVEVLGGEEIDVRGMGAFAAVAKGTDVEPRLIELRYEGPGASGPLLGLVGKAVTFDSGGLSLKPARSMAEMKFDMSGGAAVLEAVSAIAELGLPARVLAVVGATENLPSGGAVKPGDIVLASDGTSIQIDNTDAEGRLVLADCLLHARSAGAERLVDIATLTGAIAVTFGSTYAGLMASDDDWARAVEGAAAASGERVWRLPLHPDYARRVEGRYADLTNAPAKREAGSITAAEFLRRFTGETPWAHLDIAGVAWDSDRPYAAKGGNGFGVRLLVALARASAG